MEVDSSRTDAEIAIILETTQSRAFIKKVIGF